MDFPPANGWCSTTCRWLFTSFTRTSARSTASKIYGATHPGYNGKRQQLADKCCSSRRELKPAALTEPTESDVLRSLDGRPLFISAMARTAEYPLTQPAEPPVWANSAEQVWEGV